MRVQDAEMLDGMLKSAPWTPVPLTRAEKQSPRLKLVSVK